MFEMTHFTIVAIIKKHRYVMEYSSHISGSKRITYFGLQINLWLKNDHQVFFNSIERSLNVKRTSILEKMKSLPKFWEEEYLNASCTESEETYVDKHHYCSSTSFKCQIECQINYILFKWESLLRYKNYKFKYIYYIYNILVNISATWQLTGFSTIGIRKHWRKRTSTRYLTKKN